MKTSRILPALLAASLLLACPDAEENVGSYVATPAEAITNPAPLLTLMAGTAEADVAYGIAGLSENEAIVSGRTLGAMPGQTSNGQGDVFVARYQGLHPVWTKQLGTEQMEEGAALALGPDGSIYVTGYSKGAFGGNANKGLSDIYVAKLTLDGEVLWTRLFGTSGGESSFGIAVSAGGTVYVVGESDAPLDSHNAGSRDAFVLALGEDGAEKWWRTIGSTGNDQAWAVAVDASGDAIVAGSATFGLDGTGQGRDVFVARYSSTGDQRWVKSIGGDDQFHFAGGVALGSDGSIAVAAYTWGLLSLVDDVFSYGPLDAQLYLLASDGTTRWTQQIATDASEASMGVVVDTQGNVTLAGFTKGALEGQRSAGDRDLFLASFTSTGEKRWLFQLGSDKSDLPYAVSGGPGASIWMAGATAGHLGSAANSGEADAFVLRIGDL